LDTEKKVSMAELQHAAYLFREVRELIEALVIQINPVELVTPVNLNKAKSAWIEKAKNGVFENPVFEYDQSLIERTIKKRTELKSMKALLESIRPPKSELACLFVWEQLYLAVNDAINTTLLAECMRDRNDEDAGRYIREKYGVPGDLACSNALSVVLDNLNRGLLEQEMKPKFLFEDTGMTLLKDSELNSEFIREMFLWTMDQYPAEHWEIDIDDGYGAIDVRDKSKKGHPIIAIPTSRKVNGYKLAELIGHEIECHWRSSVNAGLIGAVKCDDELVYEGLAVLKDKTFNRDYLGTFNMNNAYYIVSMREALNGHSFEEVARLIYNYFPDNLANRAQKAWIYTYRVFRGISDTSNRFGYAFTKDRAYFEGYNLAIELEKQGQADYLSFSTLPLTSFERFMEITDLEDIKKNAVPDLHIQAISLEKILKKLQASNPEATAN
jgi:hypothetical protein